MARVDVVTHETACAPLVAGRQVLFLAGDHCALFGLETRVAGNIVIAWFLTLPAAALVSGIVYLVVALPLGVH